MARRKLGDIIDQLNVIGELDDHDHVLDAIVTLRVANTHTGATRFGIAYSQHADFIVRRGMTELANDFETAYIALEEEPDDDEPPHTDL